ncbi:DMT family transporter [Streptosporangium sp. 'caverna']|uniref:EamA family transporter n=1 Tax=Streptosporangium sp. 'caverna' TaxID=2202249 RepID=UPI000D7E76F3|nr:DMT family transporter [Streptosporangium sp. 'caverna']AWS44535.1 EamA family transporter [Streptosporangium sp. 'caverna']
MPRSSANGLILAVVSALCFGFSGPLARSLIDAGLSPSQVVWTRLAGAALVLLLVTLVSRPRALVVPRHRLVFVAAYSLLGFAAVQAFYYATVARLPVGIASLLEYAAPVLVLAWVGIVRRVRLPRAALVGAVLAIGGLACVVEVWRGLRLDGLGLILGFATAACAAVYFLLSQDAGKDVDPLGVLTWGLIGAVVALVPLVRPWSLPWHLLTADLALGERTLPGPLVVGWLVVVGTVIAYITGIAAVRRLSAAIGATIASLEVVASVVIAWWLLGQSLGPFQLLGGALVLSGALSAQLAVARTRSARPGDAGPGERESDGSTPVGVGLGRIEPDDVESYERGTRGVRVRIATRSSPID